MSDNKDNLDIQKSVRSDINEQKQPITVSKESVVEVAKKHSAKDMILWLLAIVAMILATLVSQYLPRYWAAANDIWVQIGITVALVVFGFVCLAFTNQGSAFKTLLKDAGIELRRITWPSKDETTRYTWQVIVVMIIIGVIIWLLDLFFNYIIGFII
ncbi:protein translocase subunit secE/sec61 gamma [Moraxella cuniculi DSM 21768]|uniref:Protein translocase subunit SecE n=1 Tax=Moraxella cuniculi DSM 21768 TaxID=1122245 RepID=A0A1N7E403_9GAMM|nr:preprotein translocase subunit SecE [Moraxella cuniculi]OOS04665.1 preprotein translocase subunit SecE [Moraxella cuniculi]SIR82813.1 protein translocase subunit secE/sec61 gamma [Moraxella cuniculi DSM 21768]